MHKGICTTTYFRLVKLPENKTALTRARTCVWINTGWMCGGSLVPCSKRRVDARRELSVIATPEALDK